MATTTEPRQAPAPPRGGPRALLVVAVLLLLAILALAILAFTLSGVTLASDKAALAKIQVQPFGGSIESATAKGPDGRAIPLMVKNGRITPKAKVRPGETVTVDVTVKRPGWSGWALGSERKEHLTVKAPVAHLESHWLTYGKGSQPRVEFAEPVAAVGVGRSRKLARHELHSASSYSLQQRPVTGSLDVAAAPRPWERLGRPSKVTWFPASKEPIAVLKPAPGGTISPAAPIRLELSKPISKVFGSRRPSFEGGTTGKWKVIDSHTLLFTPSGFGAAFDSTLRLNLPTQVQPSDGKGMIGSPSSQLQWTVPGGSTLRLHQLLAQAGYLPLTWSAAGEEVQKTPAAEVAAAVEPPEGSFSWRYPDTPSQLQGLWNEDEANLITKGAIMKFESEHGMTVDGEAGPEVWHELIKAAMAGERLGGGKEGGYTYVYVHREIPETLTLWHDGETVLTSAANTGIAGVETELGTFPVFEHIPEGTMEGVNPDGTPYHDEGIKYISYFNGGDAVHNFDRASFGTPQSLGCVELPLEDSADVYPYMPIGTLVTIET